jgi:hypothetical protein
MPQFLAQERKRWNAAAASLALFLALPTFGSAQTSIDAPPTVSLPFTSMETAPAGPILGWSVPGGPMLTTPVSAGHFTENLTGCPCNGGSGRANCPGPDEHGLFEALSGSICGKYDASCHTPLGLGNFLEGWLDPWVPPGTGSSGATRTGWVNAPDGFFRREGDLLYSYTRGVHGMPDEHIGEALLFLPLSRRLEVVIFVPFADSLVPGPSSFGDLLVAGRAMLIETQDLGVTAGLTVRTPTGSTSTSNGRTFTDPFAELWTDIGGGWEVRAGIDVNVPVDRMQGLPDAVLTTSLAVGRSFKWPLGEFTPYLATNYHESFNTALLLQPSGAFGPGTAGNFRPAPTGSSGRVRDLAQCELTPGVHAQLVQSEKMTVHFVWGITIPVTGPRAYDTNNQFFLVFGW